MLGKTGPSNKVEIDAYATYAHIWYRYKIHALEKVLSVAKLGRISYTDNGIICRNEVLAPLPF